MDVLRELRWARWGEMEVREVEAGGGRARVITPRSPEAKPRAYELSRTRRSLLDDLLEAIDSEPYRAALLAVGGARSVAGQQYRRALEIQQGAFVVVASRWGLLTVDATNEAPFEPLDIWYKEVGLLAKAWLLLRTGGALSSLALGVFADALADAYVDDPPPAPASADERLPTGERLPRRGLWFGRPGPTLKQIQGSTRAEAAKVILGRALTYQLARAGVQVVVRGSRYALLPRTLLGAAWLELGDRVLRAKPAKDCPQCGAVFVPPTARRVFCSERCKDNAKNARRSAKTKARRAR
jgi:predicted nucleic acid-binding Zn ribbon protein